MTRAACILAAVLTLAGCASSPEEPPAAPTADIPPDQTLDDSAFASLSALSSRAFISQGSPFVVAPLAPLTNTVDEAALAPASIARITHALATGPAAWLPARAWRSAAPDELADATFLLIPRDALAGRDSLLVGDRAISLLRIASEPAPFAATLTGAFAQFDAPLADASLRWRARLALEAHGIDPSSLHGFEDPAVEAFATALELRARAAIARLAEYDYALAQRFEHALGRTLTFPDGVIAPAWPPADAALEDTFDVLLDDSAPRAAAANRARQWLDAQTRAVAWVADDAGPLGARLLVAELAGAADLLSARAAPSNTCDPPALLPLLPGAVAEVDLRCRAAPAKRTVHLGVGAWADSLDVLAAPIEVSPPGVRAGPFVLPHSMRSALAGQIALPDSAYATAALIRRKPGSDQWEVYAECLAPTPDNGDTLRVFFGRRDAARELITVRASGESTRTRFDPAGAATPSAASVVVRRLDDRWVCFFDISPDAFEPDGTLIVGAERTDARGVRSVWPRPILPWESEPPRLAIDPSTWPPLGAPAR